MPKPEFIEMDLVAPAKINLWLDVGKRDASGKHRLSTVMQSVSLCDTMHVQADWDPENAGIEIDTAFGEGIDPEDIPLEKNLVYKALMTFCDYIGKPMGDRVHIDLVKNVPPQSGLGGGSSDCAGAIKLMAMLYRLDPNGPEAMEVARMLGSDVAFFIDGGCALLEGYGDIHVARYPSPELHLALARPRGGLRTPDVYGKFDEISASTAPDDPSGTMPEVASLISEGADAARIAGAVGNGLQPAACELLPGIVDVLDAFGELPGVLASSVTGSGAACYAICDSCESAERVADAMIAKGFWSRACESVSFGAGWEFDVDRVTC